MQTQNPTYDNPTNNLVYYCTLIKYDLDIEARIYLCPDGIPIFYYEGECCYPKNTRLIDRIIYPNNKSFNESRYFHTFYRFVPLNETTFNIGDVVVYNTVNSFRLYRINYIFSSRNYVGLSDTDYCNIPYEPMNTSNGKNINNLSKLICETPIRTPSNWINLMRDIKYGLLTNSTNSIVRVYDMDGNIINICHSGDSSVTTSSIFDPCDIDSKKNTNIKLLGDTLVTINNTNENKSDVKLLNF